MEKPGVGRTALEHFQFCFYLPFQKLGANEMYNRTQEQVRQGLEQDRILN